jgi:ribosomal-protein-alanine N-acetyltransferase
MPPISPILTERLLLRDFVHDDWTAVHRYGSDPEVMRWLSLPPNTEEITQRFLARKTEVQWQEQRSSFELAVTLAPKGELIGSCRVSMVNPAQREASIGYVLRRDMWGNGYTTEAAREILRMGFEQLGAHRVFATCDAGNVASYRVMEKLGMRREGRHAQDRWVPTLERWRDTFHYAILEDEWRSSQ